jgi:hypothetical protein
MTILKEGMFSCVRICVEVDLKNRLLEAVLLTLENWKHEKPLDYEKLPFKCKVFHEYGHFTKNYKNAVQEAPPIEEKEEQRKIVKRKMNPKKTTLEKILK